MHCPLCQRLENESEGAEREYAKALKALDERLETATRSEYAKLRLAESDARIGVEMLRRQMKHHRLSHE